MTHADPIRHFMPTRRAGFTLIELLVVVAVIALLVGLILPALALARGSAEDMKTRVAIRELTLGYHMYAADHSGALIPAYLSADEVRNTKVLDPFTGITIGHADGAAQRYVWRLAPYVDGEMVGTFFEEGELADFVRDTIPDEYTAFGWHYTTSFVPSFGLNGHFLGGYSFNPLPEGIRPVKRMSGAANPVRLVAFAQARSVASFVPNYEPSRFFPDSYSGRPVGLVEGSQLIDPPTWNFSFFGSSGGWADESFTAESDPEHYGNLDARLSTGEVAVSLLDGHVEAFTVEELRDMTRWANPAQKKNDSAWSPLEN